VVLFTAGGIATPSDAAMMMQLGADGVFVGSGIFKSGNPAERANAPHRPWQAEPPVPADPPPLPMIQAAGA
jgi:thiazole synthase ThiGH ThiG subunit